MLLVDGWPKIAIQPPAGKVLLRVVVAVQGDADLLQVVDARDPPRGLAGGLDGRQEQRDQHRDDRDDHQQLDQREAARRVSGGRGTGRSFPGPGRRSASRKGSGVAVAHARAQRGRRCPGCFRPKHRLGVPVEAVFWLASRSVPDAFPRALARSGTVVRGPPRLQRRSRAGISPASCPAFAGRPTGRSTDL